MKKISSFYVFLAIIIFLCACSAKDEDEKGDKDSSKEIQQQSDSEAKNEDLLLAEVDTLKIYKSDIIYDILNIQKETHGTPIQMSIEEITEKVLDELINAKIIYDDAKASGFLDNDISKVTIKYFTGLYKSKKIDEIVVEELSNTIKEEDINARLPKHFEKISLRQIILPTKEEAEKILKKVKSGEDYIKLVNEHSTGPTAFIRDGLTDEFFIGSGNFSNKEDEEAAFKLKTGEVYDGVVETPLGYMIYKIESKVILSDEEIEELKNTLRIDLLNRRRGEYIKDLYSKYEDRLVALYTDLYDIIEKDIKGEDVSNLVVGKIDDIQINYSCLDLIKDTYKLEREVFLKNSVSNNYYLYEKRLKHLINVLILEDNFKDIEVSEAVKRALDLKIKKSIALLYIKYKFDRIKMTDEIAKQFYDENPDVFTKKARVKAEVIVLPTLKEAELVKKRYEEGEDFGKLVKELSIDETTKKNKGDIGWIKSNSKMVPENVLKAMFATKVGELSEPIEDNSGYTVVHISDKEEASKIPFDIQDKWLRETALKEKKWKANQDYLKSLNIKDKMVKYDENIEVMVNEIKKIISEKAGSLSMEMSHQ